VRTESLSLKGRWLALTAATIVLQFSYWTIVAGATADPDVPEALESGAGMLAFGLAVVPFVFLVLAFASRHPRAPGAALKAMGLFLLIGLPLGLLNVVVGTAVGFAAGGVLALRPVEGVDTRKRRWIAVLALALYLGVLLLIVPPFGLVSGAVLPLAIHGLVDQAVAEHEGTGGDEDEHAAL
jgi:hypothetical protein